MGRFMRLGGPEYLRQTMMHALLARNNAAGHGSGEERKQHPHSDRRKRHCGEFRMLICWSMLFHDV